MCSLGDDYENNEEKYLPQKNIGLDNCRCNKCRHEKASILLRGKDAYCRNCFLASTNHKFKAILGKSKLIRPYDKVLISFDVGHPSVALLHLIRSGLDLDTPKRLKFIPVVVFIEDRYHLSLDERKEMLRDIQTEVNNFQLKLYFVSLANCLSSENEINISENILNVTELDKAKLSTVVANNANETTKNELLFILKRNVLLKVAKNLDCKFIFTPELSIDIASNLLSNVSLGRGDNISLDTGFCDNRDERVKILRPLRDFDMKEVAFYNVLHHLNPISVRGREVNSNHSVQNLMRDFITKLQSDYPATVTTIVKTGDKLTTQIKDNCDRRCRLCNGTITQRPTELSSEESTNFSKLISNSFRDPTIPVEDRCKSVVEGFTNSPKHEQL
ncbi:cytoplasmic tRNA 2-thiolation protein 2 isoform X2 [Cylas formicarius]|uniref:cytoplasmic tRNA 2-thiolation protein 2 isoform X2 n=1 Tax=Cylas formicarius TaxID=197179 RepID=UPI0029587491|nr:cytoplasmic tRNA 2-thiolation protein 2 isoform X2 [Cylas formicarius]